MTPEECVVIYGKAWFERDDAKRIEVLRQCCTEDIVFVDPQLGRLHGLQEVSDMIGHYMKLSGQLDSPETESKGEARGRSGGGVSVEVTTGIDTLHRFFRYSFVWTVNGVRGTGGTDYGEFAEDGRMKLITVWPGSADFPVV
jgi:hypothetical protein